MKKKITALMVSLGMILLTGCQNMGTVDVTTLQIKNDGTIYATHVEDFDKSYYDIDELEISIDTLIAEYNREAGENSITVDKVQQKDTKAIVKMEYSSAKNYNDFNRVPFFVGAVDVAYLAGYEFDELTSVSGDGSTISLKEADKAGYIVVAVQEKINIKVPGKVLYTSDTVSLVSAKKVSVTDDETVSYIIYE